MQVSRSSESKFEGFFGFFLSGPAQVANPSKDVDTSTIDKAEWENRYVPYEGDHGGDETDKPAKEIE